MGCRTVIRPNLEHRPYIEHKALYQIDGWQASQNKGIYSTEEVGRYLSFFVDRWVERGFPGTKEQVEEVFNRMELHWQQTAFVDPENPEQRLRGLTHVRYFKDEIVVFVYDCSQEKKPVLGATALGHELIHVALYATTGKTEHTHFDLPDKEWPVRYLDLQEEVDASFRESVR
jgi:hypothetical protein